MKIIILALSILLISGCATGPQHAVVPPENRSHTAVIEVPGVTKETLFNRASEWVALTYVSSQKVIQEKNPQTGRIVGRAITSATIDNGGLVDPVMDCYYSLVIDVKDGRARIQLGDYNWVKFGNEPTMAMFIDPINNNMKKLSGEFKTYLETGASGSMSGSDDW